MDFIFDLEKFKAMLNDASPAATIVKVSLDFDCGVNEIIAKVTARPVNITKSGEVILDSSVGETTGCPKPPGCSNFANLLQNKGITTLI